jgi:hypothetical protein
MATATVYITGDVGTPGWDVTYPASPTTHWTKIDEGTASPDDADYNEVTTPGAMDQYSFGASPANADTITEVSIPFRGKLTDGTGAAHFEVQLWRTGATVQVGVAKDVTVSDLGGSGVVGTVTLTWTGLTLTKAQFDSLTKKVYFRTA